MPKIDFTFFNSNEALRFAVKELVDAKYYHIGHGDMPLSQERVDEFFRDWPQYLKFPYMDELKENKGCLQSDAIMALSEYTTLVDGTFFLF